MEAEAVGYVVGRHFGLDTSGSAFYLAAWQDDDIGMLQDRLGRISSTAETIVDAAVEEFPTRDGGAEQLSKITELDHHTSGSGGSSGGLLAAVVTGGTYRFTDASVYR